MSNLPNIKLQSLVDWLNDRADGTLLIKGDGTLMDQSTNEWYMFAGSISSIDRIAQAEVAHERFRVAAERRKIQLYHKRWWLDIVSPYRISVY